MSPSLMSFLLEQWRRVTRRALSTYFSRAKATLIRKSAPTTLTLMELEERCLPSWIPIGPAPQESATPISAVTGRVSALSLVPTSIDGVRTPTLFLGAAGGGIWRSIDYSGDPINGRVNPSWQPLTDQIELGGGTIPVGLGAIDVGAIATVNDLTNPNGTIYVGTGEANYSFDSRYGTGLLKSTDGGNTFQIAATGTPDDSMAFLRRSISKILIDPRNSNVLYMAVVPSAGAASTFRDGIYKSTTAGATWQKLTYNVPLDPLDETHIGDAITVTDLDYNWNSTTSSFTLFAGVAGVRDGSPKGGVWKSEDNGEPGCG